MALPAGVVVGQGISASFDEYSPITGVFSFTYPAGMASVATRGAAVKRTATAGQVDLTLATDTVLAGILGQSTYDPAALPASVAERIYGDGIWTDSRINQPCSVWKRGTFHLVNVNGVVAYGDFMGPDAAGAWKSYGAVNPLKNGSVIAEVGNTTAGGSITVSADIT